jgi:hypothetical protein
MMDSNIYFIGVVALLVIVVFVRVFLSVIEWEIAFDMRIISFGFHTFLLGMLFATGLLGWFGYIPALTNIFQ